MAKRPKTVTLDDPAKRVLSVLLAEFQEKRFGAAELEDTYRGLAPATLKSICTTDGGLSEVDFDLAIKELEEYDLVETGPMELYDNPPGSTVTVIAFYSKNEYSYLTEEGYKLATRFGTRPPRMPAPRVHISGGTFHQSPVAVGTQVSQTVNISASSDELLARLREEVQERVVDDQKRSEIMLHIDALEEAQGKPSMIERYNKLVGVIGDHVTVFGPVLTLLLQRLMGS
jgi:hypothetical protein